MFNINYQVIFEYLHKRKETILYVIFQVESTALPTNRLTDTCRLPRAARTTTACSARTSRTIISICLIRTIRRFK